MINEQSNVTSTTNAIAFWQGHICALIVVLCVLACRPWGEIGYIDDWSMVRTAKVLAETGHFTYNGWAAMTEGWQIVWGAAVVHIFGFSYFVLRASLLPVVFVSILLFHQSLLSFGFSRKEAAFGALSLGLSPVFLPVASSFMTDIPSLAVTLLCLVLCQKAVNQKEDRNVILWLALATITNLIGGTVRQTAFLGVLVMIPCVGWWQRNRRGVFLSAALMTLLGAVFIAAFLHWFSVQPYSVPENIFAAPLKLTTLEHLTVQLLIAFIFLMLSIIPILFLFVPAFLRLSAKFFWSLYAMLSAALLLLIATKDKDVLGAALDKFGISITTTSCAAILILLGISLWIFRKFLAARTNAQLNSDIPSIAPWTRILWLLGPFSVAYFLLLFPRGSVSTIWDRYLLGLTPIAIISLLKVYRSYFGKGIPAIAIVALVLMAYFGVGKGDRRHAQNRALLQAANIVRANENLPRQAVSAGFEYDNESQLDLTGYVNEPKIKVPANAYRPYTPPPGLPPDVTDFSYTPDITPKFFIVPKPITHLATSKFPPLRYSTLLPPFHGTVYIQQLPQQ